MWTLGILTECDVPSLLVAANSGRCIKIAQILCMYVRMCPYTHNIMSYMCVCRTDRQNKTDRQEFQTYTLLYTMLRLQNEFAYACACTMPLGRVAQLVYVYACTYVCAHTHVRMFAPIRFDHACPLNSLTHWAA